MSVTAPATPATPEAGQGGGGAGVQPAPGQGQGSAATQSNSQQGDSGFWGNFPDVPEGQRQLLEPHLKNIQGHITKLEQQSAPYRSLMDSVPADQVENLVAFLGNYNQDPVATALGLFGSLHESGRIENPEFSLDAMQNLINAPAAAPDPTMPEWAQALQSQMAQITQENERRNTESQQQAAAEEQRVQQQMMVDAHATITETLKNAGLPEGLVTPEMMTGAIVSHRGDVTAAAQEFINYKEGLLKSWVESNSNGGRRDPTIVGGAPSVPQNGLKQKSGDGFRSASRSAEQFLRSNAAAQ